MLLLHVIKLYCNTYYLTCSAWHCACFSMYPFTWITWMNHLFVIHSTCLNKPFKMNEKLMIHSVCLKEFILFVKFATFTQKSHLKWITCLRLAHLYESLVVVPAACVFTAWPLNMTELVLHSVRHVTFHSLLFLSL